MWAYNFFSKKHRFQIPTLKAFIRRNYDIFKCQYLKIPTLTTNSLAMRRSPFWLRILKFITNFCILFLSVFIAIQAYKDFGYYQDCKLRETCQTACQKNGFPAICPTLSGVQVIQTYNNQSPQIVYNGNIYNKLYKYTNNDLPQFKQCKLLVKDNPNFGFIGSRQERVHTCFNFCHKLFEFRDGDTGFSTDQRQTNCSAIDQASLLCVQFSDDCEYNKGNTEIVLKGSGKNQISFEPWMGLLAVVIANPIQVLFQLLYIVQSRCVVDDVQSNSLCRKSTAKCMFQLLVVAISGTIVIYSIILGSRTYYRQSKLLQEGRSNLLWMTVLYSFLIDQTKSIFLLMLCWYCMFRRCGYLQVNQIQKSDIQIQSEKNQNFIIWVQKWIMKFLEHRITEIISFVLIMVYTVFILIWLSFDSVLNSQAQSILQVIDFVFLIVFIVQISFKTFASSFQYLFDFWNLFDAAIVIVSFILTFFIQAKGIAVLRLIRAVVMTLRAIAGKKLRFRHQAFQKNPQPAMKAIINKLIENQAIPNKMKRQITWTLTTIQNDRLYKYKRVGELGAQNAIDPQAKQWMNLASSQSNVVSSWFDKDLDDILHQIHRENQQFSMNKLIEHDYLFGQQQSQLSSKQYLYAAKVFQKLNAWDFDTLSYVEVLGDHALPHFGFKLFAAYGLIQKFSIKEKNFMRLIGKIRSSFYQSTQFSNLRKAIEVTRNMHFFIVKGRLLQQLSDLYILSGLLAGLIHDIGHPGLEAQFLIAQKHEKALRYNDISVLEKHHLALGFKILHDFNCDIFENMSEAQYWSVRSIIIGAVLSTDIRKHFDHINEWKKALQTRNFPQDIDDDKQRLLNMTIYVADHSFATKPLQQFIKWLNLMTQEMFLQGDIEKKSGYIPQQFYDRTTSNPFIYWKGYIQVIVEPIMELWCDFIPDLRQILIEKGLENNKREIEDKIQQTVLMYGSPQFLPSPTKSKLSKSQI